MGSASSETQSNLLDLKNISNKELSETVYKLFSEKEGNQHIAGLFAIEKLLDLIEFNKPTAILEVGLGIGSISYAILKYAKMKNIDISYDGTEANGFCLDQLKLNLAEYYSEFNIYSDIDALNKGVKYDFVIIDGSDDSLEKIKDVITEKGVIFIEGCRQSQRQKVQEIFPKHVHNSCISDFKNPTYGPFTSDIWSGGGQLIYINPTMGQKLHYIKERIKTSFRYRVKRKVKLKLNMASDR